MKRCIYCGRLNHDKLTYCQYCGESLNPTEYSDVHSNEFEENHKYENKNPHCPRCGSSRVFFVTKESGDFAPSNACCGYILFGPLGLLCGLVSNKETVTMKECQDCGYQF